VIYSVVYFVPVIRYSSFVICCAFICQLLFVINRSFILFVVRLFILFSSSLNFACFIVVQKKKNNFDPELCSGISIPLKEEVPYPLYLLPVSTSSSRVNKHHTADSTDFVLV
jgi:hypothetical protein